MWEFRSSQQSDPDAMTQVLKIAGHTLDLAGTVFCAEADEGALRVHVGVFHPVFPQLPKAARQHITYLVLDWLLGEDDVERWIGQVDILDTAPIRPIPAHEVIALVREVASHQDPDEWTLARWQDEDGVSRACEFPSRSPMARLPNSRYASRNHRHIPASR